MVAKKRPRVIYFPTLDYLTPYQQKKKLKELSGKVVSYNMYDNIQNVPKLDEIYAMPYDNAKVLIETLRGKYTVKQLTSHWGITDYTIYKKVFGKYDIEMQEPSNKKKKKTVANQTKPMEITESDIPTKKVITQGFKIELGGIYTGEEVSDRLLRLDQLLNKESNYFIQVVIKED